MNTRSFVTLWIIGIGSVLVWFWGIYLGIPKDAQVLAQSLASALLGYAVRHAENSGAPLSQPPQSTGEPS